MDSGECEQLEKPDETFAFADPRQPDTPAKTPKMQNRPRKHASVRRFTIRSARARNYVNFSSCYIVIILRLTCKCFLVF